MSCACINPGILLADLESSSGANSELRSGSGSRHDISESHFHFLSNNSCFVFRERFSRHPAQAKRDMRGQFPFWKNGCVFSSGQWFRSLPPIKPSTRRWTKRGPDEPTVFEILCQFINWLNCLWHTSSEVASMSPQRSITGGSVFIFACVWVHTQTSQLIVSI